VQFLWLRSRVKFNGSFLLICFRYWNIPRPNVPSCDVRIVSVIDFADPSCTNDSIIWRHLGWRDCPSISRETIH
jgi:hypothetical protein